MSNRKAYPACGGFPQCRCKPFACAAGCGSRMTEHAKCGDCAGKLCEKCCDKLKDAPADTSSGGAR